jgi:hypothetical protein
MANSSAMEGKRSIPKQGERLARVSLVLVDSWSVTRTKPLQALLRWLKSTYPHFLQTARGANLPLYCIEKRSDKPCQSVASGVVVEILALTVLYQS